MTQNEEAALSHAAQFASNTLELVAVAVGNAVIRWIDQSIEAQKKTIEIFDEQLKQIRQNN